jgi:hypothetical protein
MSLKLECRDGSVSNLSMSRIITVLFEAVVEVVVEV